MTAALLVALSLAAPAPSPAPPSPSPPDATAAPVLTMDDAVRAALARRPLLSAAQGAVDAAEAGIREARGALLPQVGTAGRYELRRDWPPAGGAFSDDALSASLSADVLLFDFDRTRSRVRAARASAEASAHDAQATVHDVALEVRLAYLGILEAHALEEVARERFENQERHLAQTTEMVRVGTRAAIDLARLRTQVASARAALLRAGNAVRTARTRLDVAMGAPGQAAYSTSVPELPPLALEAEPVTTLFAHAAERRPELASLRASLVASGHAVKSAERSLWPSLRLGGGASGAGFDVTGDEAFAASVGVSLSWPIFDGFSSRAAADAARARLEIGRAQLGDREQRVWEELEVAASSVASARAELPAAQEALAAARELLGLAEARYREGVGSSLELADAELELASAAAQRVQVEYDLASARAQLVRALGREAWE